MTYRQKNLMIFYSVIVKDLFVFHMLPIAGLKWVAFEGNVPAK